MNIDFLDVLSRPAQNAGNTWEHWEQKVFMRVRAFPAEVRQLGTRYLFQLLTPTPAPSYSHSVSKAWEQKDRMFMRLFPLFPSFPPRRSKSARDSDENNPARKGN